jgi:hypothetical protein
MHTCACILTCTGRCMHARTHVYMCACMRTSLRVCRHHTVTDSYIPSLVSYYVIFLTYNGNKNCYTRDLLITLLNHSYSRHDIPMRCFRQSLSTLCYYNLEQNLTQISHWLSDQHRDVLLVHKWKKVENHMDSKLVPNYRPAQTRTGPSRTGSVWLIAWKGLNDLQNLKIESTFKCKQKSKV